MKRTAVLVALFALTGALSACADLTSGDQPPTATPEAAMPITTIESVTPGSASDVAGTAQTATTIPMATTESVQTTGPPQPPQSDQQTTTTKPKPPPAQPAETTTSLMLSPITMEILPTTWTRFEESDPHILWDGPWSTYSAPEASGGSFRVVGDHAAFRVNFRGTGIRLVCMLGSVAGIAKLTLDDVYVYTADLYSPTTASSVVFEISLPLGRHTLLGEWTGTMNGFAVANDLTFDAVEVMGYLVD